MINTSNTSKDQISNHLGKMAELEETVKKAEVTENEPDSHTTAYEEEELNMKGNQEEEDQRNSQDGQMSLTVEELNQDQTEGEHKDCFQDPELQKENALEQDLTENGVKEEEITIDMVEKNGSQSEKHEKPEENNVKETEMIEREFEKKNVEEGNQDQSESENLRECLEPCITNERDKQDKEIGHSHKEDKDTRGPEGKKNVLTADTLTEHETNIKLLNKNACQGEKTDESEVNNIKNDGTNVELEKEKGHVEDGNQNQSETEKPKECLEPIKCLSNEERDEHGDDQVEQDIENSHEQDEDTRGPEGNKNDLTGNSLAEGATNIKLLDNNACQGEKNDDSEVNNIKEDGTNVEFEKKKSQDEEVKTRKLTQQSSEVKKNSTEDGEINTMPEEKETRQDKNDQEETSETTCIKVPQWKVRYYTIQTGNTRDSHKKFLKTLHEKKSRLKQSDKAKKCKFCIVFCPVVSRAGTDIEAALLQLKEISDTKPAVLVVLHHTIDPECIVPDSSRAVQRENMIAVDCVFHEDHRLYKCVKNKEAVEKVAKWIKTKPWRNVK